VTVWETVLVFGVLPLAGFGLLALLVFGPGTTRAPRYRPGRKWEYDPVWYIARPLAHAAGTSGPAASGVTHQEIEATAGRRALPEGSAARKPPASVLDAPVRTARGGASGEW
jgi:hypothetical protein